MAAPAGFTESGLTLLEGINWISRDSQGLTLQWSGSRRSLTRGFRAGTATTPRREAVGGGNQENWGFAKSFEFALKIFIWMDFEIRSVKLSYWSEEKRTRTVPFWQWQRTKDLLKKEITESFSTRLVTFYVIWWIIWRHVVCKVLFVHLM